MGAVSFPPPEIRENVPLAPLTTLGIGGPARFFVEALEERAVAGALAFAEERQAPVFVLGGGSNILVADEGFPGLVIRMAIAGITESADPRSPDLARWTAGAGEGWDGLVRRAVQCGLAGIECLSGIPGTVGGTPIQNVGAYGQQVASVIAAVRVWDREARCALELDNTGCRFSYRRSVFNTTARDRYVVLSVSYSLTRDGAPALEYADLRKFFASCDHAPGLAEVRAAVLAVRARKGMVIEPGDPDCRSAGSFFKNPVVAGSDCEAMAQATGGPVPSYPVAGDSDRVKVPAAWLIEQAGFRKGYGCGPAGISGKHALALINRGGASAADVIALMREIQAGVRDRFGVELLPEPQFIGFRGNPAADSTDPAG